MGSALAPAGPYAPPYEWQWFAHNIILVVTLIVTFGLCLSIPVSNRLAVPYGRVVHKMLGPMALNCRIDGRIAWWFMEAPTVYVSVIFFFLVGGNEETGFRWPINRFEPAPLVMFCLYQLHYLQRTCVYPFVTRPGQVTLLILMASFVWNALSAYLIASFIGDMGTYPVEWLYNPRFIIGLVIYLAGYTLNRYSDHLLAELRRRRVAKEKEHDDNDEEAPLIKPGSPDPDVYVNPVTKRKYFIPRGALFEYVSCPNYLGEILIWLGFALLSFSLEGFALFLMTCGNLIPRAMQNHRFYLENFPNYPKLRKAVIPFIL